MPDDNNAINKHSQARIDRDIEENPELYLALADDPEEAADA